ncbi:MAG TPA: hypothetical protein PKV86_07865 [Syntrophobacteraceae bacterium]|nr:hypothetical protein [Syntrophobacteraceae bacterium]
MGSSSFDTASRMGNDELDIAMEDAAFARSMEQMVQSDLERSTERNVRYHRARVNWFSLNIVLE